MGRWLGLRRYLAQHGQHGVFSRGYGNFRTESEKSSWGGRHLIDQGELEGRQQGWPKG